MKQDAHEHPYETIHEGSSATADAYRDAEQLLGLVNDAARLVSARFVTFLTVGVYVAVTIASTTDEMLVWGSLVTLPLLNTQIPISGLFGFYTLAPWLIVVLHSDILTQLLLLGSKVSDFQRAVSQLNEGQRGQLYERLTNFHYVKFLTREGPSRLLRILSSLTVCGSMIVLPLLLLCWTQIRFLPLHQQGVTSSQRLSVVADILLILIFLWRPLSPRAASAWSERVPSGRTLVRNLLSLRTLVLAVCASVLVVSSVADIAGEYQAKDFWFARRNLNLREKVLTTHALTPDVINALRDGDVRQREQELAKVSRLSFLQGRDLRYADLFNAVLPRLDLRSRRVDEDGDELIETRLQGADLRWAQMQQVLLDDANLQRARLQGAQLQGGSLARAKLQKADLSEAQMQDAKASHAWLDGAVLRAACLQGADLSGASLREASLSGAQMQGASLRGAQLQRADLSNAALQGADLSEARLDGATLRGAQLQGALLRGAIIGGADFEDANLDLTDVSSVKEDAAALESPLGTLDRAKFGRCRDTETAVTSRCTLREDGEQYVESLNRYLASLGCSDTYIARGLSAQALYSADPDRESLARTLVDIESHPKCRGMQLVSEGVKEALEKRAAPTDANMAGDRGT